MIETDRFYCVSCGMIVSVARGSVELKEEDCGGNHVFRTGFYRSEMPLGCCEACVVQTKRQGKSQFAGQYTKDYDTLSSYEKRA
ncbi:MULTISPECIES: hypothetical protein [Paenibacillus]|uniref:hypothetical protein n=1 Tax=Paenibacillus TaxID=44249 RepID=UPI0007E4AAA7|nr:MULTISPECIES: hypothetical protein [Paenibacillus]OAX50531.1 hypothetical protein gpAD87_20240 [Paenibacillus sp. AD87]MCZ1263476.1 hypothetical protein [Paenibacillus tundrae]WDQ34853.1 hypothetical protein PTQ21_11625 [Paenibacillus marchantiae]SDL25722.1 hypothetical protein SAMN05428961_104429 [Paenibacillus sp. OK060]SHN74344.1 hypothetical protein SAMN04487896_3454 [Paenibacillus sp. ov031]